MPQKINSEYQAAFANLLSKDAIGILLDVNVPSDPPTVYRMTNLNRRITFGEDENGLPIYYYPWPIAIGVMEATGEGSLPQVNITISNSTTPDVAKLIDEYDGLEGQEVTIRIVSEGELSHSDSWGFEETGEIVGVRIEQKAIALTIAAAPLYQDPMPRFRYNRIRCRKTFGSLDCGYSIGIGGATFTDCPGYTLEACEDVGEEEAARGITGLHPRLFGGQRGIPSRRRV